MLVSVLSVSLGYAGQLQTPMQVGNLLQMTRLAYP